MLDHQLLFNFCKKSVTHAEEVGMTRVTHVLSQTMAFIPIVPFDKNGLADNTTAEWRISSHTLLHPHRRRFLLCKSNTRSVSTRKSRQSDHRLHERNENSSPRSSKCLRVHVTRLWLGEKVMFSSMILPGRMSEYARDVAFHFKCLEDKCSSTDGFNLRWHCFLDLASSLACVYLEDIPLRCIYLVILSH